MALMRAQINKTIQFMKKRNSIVSLFVSLTSACDILMMIRSNLQVKWFFCVLPPECPRDMNMLNVWNGDGGKRSISVGFKNQKYFSGKRSMFLLLLCKIKECVVPEDQQTSQKTPKDI